MIHIVVFDSSNVTRSLCSTMSNEVIEMIFLYAVSLSLLLSAAAIIRSVYLRIIRIYSFFFFLFFQNEPIFTFGDRKIISSFKDKL